MAASRRDGEVKLWYFVLFCRLYRPLSVAKRRPPPEKSSCLRLKRAWLLCVRANRRAEVPKLAVTKVEPHKEMPLWAKRNRWFIIGFFGKTLLSGRLYSGLLQFGERGAIPPDGLTFQSLLLESAK